ncbi:MAG: LapA family protein [Pseudomonadota bacterium]
MRPLRLLIAIVFLAVGLVLGVLNAEPVAVDLGVVEAKAGLGVILLCTLLAGVLVGALAIVASVVLPLRRTLRRIGTQAQKPETPRNDTPALPSLSAPSET